MRRIFITFVFLSSISSVQAAETNKNYGYISGEAPQEAKDRANKTSKERKFTNPFKILFDFDKSLRPVLW